MYIPITTAALGLLTVAIVMLRVFWLRIPAKLQHLLIRSAVTSIVLQLLFSATKWNTTSDRVNALLYWAAIAGYELLLLLFTLLPPRWLTTLSALILLIPVFASSILVPLTALFDQTGQATFSLDDHLIYEKNPWATGNAATDGIDMIFFYKPRFMPFLRHKLKRTAFSNMQCNSSAASAAIEFNRKNIRVICPPWPNQQYASAPDQLVPIP